jgi:hypothetical protein
MNMMKRPPTDGIICLRDSVPISQEDVPSLDKKLGLFFSKLCHKKEEIGKLHPDPCSSAMAGPAGRIKFEGELRKTLKLTFQFLEKTDTFQTIVCSSTSKSSQRSSFLPLRGLWGGTESGEHIGHPGTDSEEVTLPGSGWKASVDRPSRGGAHSSFATCCDES